jgi:capsular polysaccharide transport system permease protein
MTPATHSSPPAEWHPRPPSLWHCFCTQCSAVYGLMLQSIAAQSRKAKLGYFWELFDPLMQIVLWFLLFIFIRGPRTIYDMNTFLFLGTGIIALFFFQRIAQEMPGAMRRFSGYARLPVITQTDTLIAGGLLEAVVMSLVAAILWSTIVLAGWGFAPADLLGVIAATACLGLLGFSFGWFNAMAIVFVPVYDRLLRVLFRVLFFTSGAIFPLERIPPEIFRYLQWNPVYQGVDMVRSAWSYTYTSTTSSNGYVLAWAAGFLLLGLLLDKPAARARARK